MNTIIKIELSKYKVMILLIGSITFFILGILFVNNPRIFTSPIMKNPEIIKVTGIASIIFFGLCSVFIAWKLFENKPGLMIDKYGITDNTNATSVGLVEWKDITGMETKQVMSNKFLILYTSNPEKYIKRGRNFFSKKAAEMNNKTYGTPITIISNSLKIDYKDLEKLIRSELEKRKISF